MNKATEKEKKRNITLSLPRELIREAKLAAVNEEKSLSLFMREALEERIKKKTAFRAARSRQLKRLKSDIDLGTQGRLDLPREELHERR